MTLLLKPLNDNMISRWQQVPGILQLFRILRQSNLAAQFTHKLQSLRSASLPGDGQWMVPCKGMENCRTIGWSFSNRKDQMSCQKTKSVIDTKTNVHYRIYRSHISKLSIKWNPSWFFGHDICGIPLVISLVRQYCKSSSMAVCGKEKRSCIGRFPTKCWDSQIFVNGCHPIHCG